MKLYYCVVTIINDNLWAVEKVLLSRQQEGTITGDRHIQGHNLPLYYLGIIIYMILQAIPINYGIRKWAAGTRAVRE